MMVKRNIKKPGPDRIYDHDKIKKGFLDGKTNPEIAAEVGCSSCYVWELRKREERKKRLFCEGRVC